MTIHQPQDNHQAAEKLSRAKHKTRMLPKSQNKDTAARGRPRRAPQPTAEPPCRDRWRHQSPLLQRDPRGPKMAFADKAASADPSRAPHGQNGGAHSSPKVRPSGVEASILIKESKEATVSTGRRPQPPAMPPPNPPTFNTDTDKANWSSGIYAVSDPDDTQGRGAHGTRVNSTTHPHMSPIISVSRERLNSWKSRREHMREGKNRRQR